MSTEKDLRKQKKVDANVSIDTSTLAQETTLESIKNKTDELTFVGDKLKVDASIDTSTLATSAKQDLLLAELQLKADLTETQPVSFTKIPLTANSAISVTCNATTTILIASNALRKGLVITNTGTKSIFIGIGASAVLNKGIYLASGGGTWVMDEYTFTTQAINGITTSSTSNISIQEFQ